MTTTVYHAENDPRFPKCYKCGAFLLFYETRKPRPICLECECKEIVGSTALTPGKAGKPK